MVPLFKQFSAAFSSCTPPLTTRIYSVVRRFKMTTTCNIAQHDCLLPASGLRARIFYPSVPDIAACTQAMFLPVSQGSWANENAYALAEYLRLPRLSIPFLTVLTNITLPWVADAEPERRPYPLVLFSSGLGGSLGAYVSICADIARTGKVVVAVEHADGTSQVAYTGSERTRIPYRRIPKGTSSDEEFSIRNGQLRQRVAELGDVLDDIRNLNRGTVEPQTPLAIDGTTIDLAGLIDESEPIIVAGHSFGACTVLAFTASAAQDRKDVIVSDAICLDPWLYPLGPKKAASSDVGDTRVLFVDQGRSGMASSIALRRELPRPSGNGQYWSVKILDGGHNNSSDYPVRIPMFIAVKFRLTAAGSDPQKLLQLQNRAVVKFLNRAEWPRYLEDTGRGVEEGVGLSVLPDAVVEAEQQAMLKE